MSYVEMFGEAFKKRGDSIAAGEVNCYFERMFPDILSPKPPEPPREKGKILSVGTIDENNNPQGWTFDGENRVKTGIEITSNGEVFFCGYSVDELREIVESNKSVDNNIS